jgi:hypothetical protein
MLITKIPFKEQQKFQAIDRLLQTCTFQYRMIVVWANDQFAHTKQKPCYVAVAGFEGFNP